MACGQMIKTRKGLLKTLKNFREKKKVRGKGGADVSDLNNDIKSKRELVKTLKKVRKKRIKNNKNIRLNLLNLNQ